MRRTSRELALQVLFQFEFINSIALNQILGLFESQVTTEVIDYAKKLIQTVTDNKDQIDEMITASSRNWKLSRMSIVDRNIIRLAICETKFLNEGINPNIAINEAVEIAKKYGSEDSAAFINGLLDQALK